MKKNILFVIAFLVVVGGGSYYFYHDTDINFKDDSVITNEKEYLNSKYGFKFRYPSGLDLIDRSIGDELNIEFSDSGIKKILVSETRYIQDHATQSIELTTLQEIEEDGFGMLISNVNGTKFIKKLDTLGMRILIETASGLIEIHVLDENLNNSIVDTLDTF